MSLAGNPKDPEPIKKAPPKPKISSKSNPEYPAASDAITIDYDESKGRYAIAARDVQAGETVLVEKPHSGMSDSYGMPQMSKRSFLQ
ncbi:unnamed protein product [Leptidea sinapis]|uniref:Uncharacterized protein n=1 Tax=Leptidea sinapis TaxID=189913 RepID=A0A5E4R6X5_9NEOP|nr:unnamed protein product [Leptidea sinapis]